MLTLQKLFIMKTIIIPTDFSPTAVNAANYAADMAVQINAGILLVHVYQLPLALTDTPIILVSIDELKESAEKKLAGLKEQLTHITSGKITIETEARLGIVSDELEEVCKRVQPFALVMGTKGHTTVERALFGSNTLHVINHLSWPIICVPQGKEYGSGIKKIGLACDLKEVVETTPIPVIRDFVQTFNSVLHVLNVSTEHRTDNPAASQQFGLLRTALESLAPSYHFIEDRDIEDGINRFAETNNLDLIITIPKKHKLMDKLFKKSSSKQLVFESHVPVLCIHE